MPEWNKLPAEMQEMIVQRSTKNTRNALRSCSKVSKALVDETEKLKRSLPRLEIFSIHDRQWIMGAKQSQYHTNTQSFPSFEELQKKLLELLKSTSCIKELSISLPTSAPPIRVINDQKRLMVESVVFGGTDESQQENILSQIEPVHLRRLLISSNGDDSRIFDMEQVVCAEKLKVAGGSSIREHQLLKLKAYEVEFNYVTCSIRKYVKKCTLEAGTRLPRFRFSFSAFPNSEPLNKVVSKVPNSHLSFEVKYGKLGHVSGGVGYDSESCEWSFRPSCQSSLRIVDQLKIRFKNEDNNNIWKITVQRQFCLPNKYQFTIFGEFQEKLDEIMENLDFVKDFRIDLTNSPESVKWRPRSNGELMMVKNLQVAGKYSVTSIRELLLQIDPNFLGSVQVADDEAEKFWSANEAAAELYNLPQIQNAYRVSIKNPFLQDDQLLKMNNVFFRSAGRAYTFEDGILFKGTCARFITSAGINKFLKKCIICVNKRSISFDLGRISKSLNEEEMFDGLDVVRFTQTGTLKRRIINTINPEYVLDIGINSENAFSCYSIRRTDIDEFGFYPYIL